MKVMQLGDSRIETLSRARYVFFYILLLSSAHTSAHAARARSVHARCAICIASMQGQGRVAAARDGAYQRPVDRLRAMRAL